MKMKLPHLVIITQKGIKDLDDQGLSPALHHQDALNLREAQISLLHSIKVQEESAKTRTPKSYFSQEKIFIETTLLELENSQ